MAENHKLAELLPRSSGPRPTSPELYRPSFAQERLWVHEQLLAGSSLYNLPIGLRLEGELDVEALQESLRVIIRHHAILRTSYPPKDGHPTVDICSAAAFDYDFRDLTWFEEGVREIEARKLAVESVARRFNLHTGPLVRLTVVKISNTVHLVVLVVHHIIVDQGSLQVMASELGRAYRTISRAQPFRMPELPFQYLDYALWERSRFESGALEKQVDFWKKQLAGSSRVDLPGSLCFPTDSAAQGLMAKAQLSTELAQRISELARSERSTIFVTLLAALCVLLHRYAGQEDISVATPTEMRKQRGTESLIGLFINTLILRTDVSGAPAFRVLLRRVRDMVLQGLANDDVPLDKIVEAVRSQRIFDENPLFNVLFFMTSQVFRCPDFGKLETKFIQEELPTAKFDLTVSVLGNDKKLAVWFEHKGGRFGQDTLASMVSQYHLLLQEIVGNPERPITAYSLMRSEEAASLLPIGGAVAAQMDDDRTVCEIALDRATKNPLAPAVRCEGKTLTYRDFEHLSNKVARWLIAHGTGPGVLVEIRLSRCLELPAVAMGVLKSGGTYTIVDPKISASPSRPSVITLRADLVLKERGEGHQTGNSGTEALEWDPELLEQFPSAPLTRRALPTSAAAIVYTAGSVARSAPVTVNHRALTRLLLSQDFFEIDQRSVWALWRVQSNGLALWEMWGPLLCGGCIAVASSDDTSSIRNFWSFLSREHVTVLSQTPLEFSELADSNPPGAASQDGLSLRTVLLSGDIPERSVVEALQQRNGNGSRAFNVYTCTEHPVPVAACEILRGKRDGILPLGQPAPHAMVYILDKSIQAVAIETLGEICLDDDGLSQGYLGNPSKTAERFIPNPFGARAGARLFRTGDLARLRPDWSLEYVGRIGGDSEKYAPRQIARDAVAVLRSHPAVRWAEGRSLLAKNTGRTEQVLIYAELKHGAEASSHQLEEYLGSNLPDSSICKVFVVGNLPRNESGKIAIHALSQLQVLEESLPQFIPPRQQTEVVLARIWAELLGVEKVGIEDNFFSLGGDSILTMQMVRMAAKAGLKFKARQVFQAQTIARLAMLAVPIESREVTPIPCVRHIEVPLIPIQKWFFEQNLANPHHWNQSIMLEIPGPRMDDTAWRKIMDAVTRHHDIFRSRFKFDGSVWTQQLIEDPPRPPFEVIDLFKEAEDNRPLLMARAIESAHERLDISSGPLFTAVLFDLGGNAPGRLFLVAHHLIIDAVSWRIMVEDIAGCYEQIQKGEPISLPPATSSFSEWAQHVNSKPQSRTFNAALWLAHESPNALWRVPPDHPEGINTEGSSSSVEFVLSEEETEALLTLASKGYAIKFEHLLVTMLGQTVLAGAEKQTLYLELEHQGRTVASHDLDLSRVVGWFTALYPVCLEIPMGPMVEAVREVSRQLDEVSDPSEYGILRYAVGDPRVTAASLPCLRFNYLGQFDQALVTAGGFKLARQPDGLQRAFGNRRTTELEITSWIVEGKLHTSWSYSRNIHFASTIESFALRQEQAMRLLARPYAGESISLYDSPYSFPLRMAARVQQMLSGDAGVEDIFQPLPSQEALLLQSLPPGDDGTDHYQLLCELHGPIDCDLLARSWQGLILRHPVLRSCFENEPDSGTPIHIVRRAVQLNFEVIDWQDKPVSDTYPEAELFLQQNAQRPMTLAEPPLLKVALFRGSGDRRVLGCSLPSIVADRRSMFSLLQQAVDGYRLLATSRRLIQERYSYRPIWERLAKLQRSPAQSYWSQYGHDLAASSRPSFLKGSAEKRTSRQMTLRHSVDSRTSSSLLSEIQRLGVSFESAAQGLWGLLLSYYSGNEEVFFGVEVPIYPEEIQNTGFIVAPFGIRLPVRIKPRPETPLDQWLREIEEEQRKNREAAHTSLPTIWNKNEQTRPFGNTTLAFEHSSWIGIQGADSNELWLDKTEVCRHFHGDFTMVFALGQELVLRVTFDQDSCDAESAGVLLEEIALLCEELLRRPQTVGVLSELLTAAKCDRQKIRDAEYDRVRASSVRRLRRNPSMKL